MLLWESLYAGLAHWERHCRLASTHPTSLSPPVPNAVESFQSRKAHSWPPPPSISGPRGANIESAQQWSEFCTAECYSVKLNKDKWFPDNSSYPFPYWFCKRLGMLNPFMQLINTKFGLSVFSLRPLKRYHTNRKVYRRVQNWLNSPPFFQGGVVSACIVSPFFFHSREEFELCPSMGLEEPCHALSSHPDHLIRELSARFQALLLISPKLLRCSGEKGNFISVSTLEEVLLYQKAAAKPSDVLFTSASRTRERALSRTDHPRASPCISGVTLNPPPPKCLRSRISSRYCPEINYLWWLFCLLTG